MIHIDIQGGRMILQCDELVVNLRAIFGVGKKLVLSEPRSYCRLQWIPAKPRSSS